MQEFKGYFEDIDDALKQLITKIPKLDLENALILGLFREGSVLAEKVARHFNLPLEYLFVTSISAPENEECEIAFVSEKMDTIIDGALIETFGISDDEVYSYARERFDRVILPKIKDFRGLTPMKSLKDKEILIITEGIETGYGVELAIKASINEGCRSVSLAVPVLSSELLELFSCQCDRVSCVLSPEYFVSTGFYYRELPEVLNV